MRNMPKVKAAKSSQRSKPPAAPRRRRRGQQQLVRQPTVRLTPLEHMIVDPCNAPLSVIYSEAMGGGVVVRVRSRMRIRNVGQNESGFVVWYPSFHNGGADGTTAISGSSNSYRGGANLFIFSGSASNVTPVNTTTTPFGSGSIINSPEGRAVADPAFFLVKSSTVAEARTLSACMRLIYTGTTSNRQGEVFAVSTLPQNAFIRSNGSVMNVDQFIANAGHTRRTSNLDVIWRPDIEAEFPRKAGQLAAAPLDSASEDVGDDAPFVLGIPMGTRETALQTSSLPGQPMGIGLAYTGQNVNTSVDLYVECTKIVQIRYAPIYGAVEEPPNNPRGVKTEQAAHATQELDRKVGNNWWVRSVADHTDRLVDTLADLTLGGSPMGPLSSAAVEVAKASLRGFAARASSHS